MTEDNKYYIPEIEEFHVGFEYEYFKDNNWNEAASDLEVDEIYQLKSDIKEKIVRVKYLDKEDIESLGFKEQDEDDDFNYRKDNFQINTYTRIGEENKGLIIDLTEDNGQALIFYGFIKNKSELKTLCKQLNIIQ